MCCLLNTDFSQHCTLWVLLCSSTAQSDFLMYNSKHLWFYGLWGNVPLILQIDKPVYTYMATYKKMR